ncbi:hypothetical protein ACOSQ4_027228 [Xanthoceras sorbifolium]
MLITFLSLVVMPHIFNKLSMTLINIFALKTRGCLRYFIGFEPRRSSVDLHLPQHKYVLDLLAKTKMLDSTACLSPAASSVKLSKFEGEPFSSLSMYRSVVGALQYLTLTQPNIAFIVNKLSQFLFTPTHLHWQACKRVL